MINAPKERGLIVYQGQYGEQIKLTFDLVRKYLVVGRSDLVKDAEIMHFGAVCKARKLDPYKRDCYLVKFSEKETAAVLTSKDYYLSRADSMTDLKYWQAGIIVERPCKPCKSSGVIGKEFCQRCEGEGIVEIHREGALPRRNDTLIGGWFKGSKEGREMPFIIEVDLQGYIRHTRSGDITQFWSPTNQPMMIRKVALSQGLREMYPDEFAKTYDPAEMPITEPLPEDAITIDTEEVKPSRDIGAELDAALESEEVAEPTAEPTEQPPLFPPLEGEGVAADEVPLTPEERAVREVEQNELYRSGLIKTFDQRMESEGFPVKSVNDALFAHMEKWELPDSDEVKVVIMEKRVMSAFVEGIQGLLEEEAATKEPPTTPPPEPPETTMPSPEEMLARIQGAKKPGMTKLANEEWKGYFDDGTVPPSVVFEFAGKWKKLFEVSIYDEGQPWSESGKTLPPAKEPPDENAEETQKAQFLSSVENLRLKVVGKIGAKRADSEFFAILGGMGYEKVQEITKDKQIEFYTSLGDLLKD